MNKKKKNPDYLKNSELYDALKEYFNFKDKNIDYKVPEKIVKMFMLMSRRIASANNFSGYTWKYDMIQDGVEDCIRYIDNYNVKYDNPFAYFTMIIRRTFIRRIQTGKKNIEKHKKFKEEYMDNCFVSHTNDGKKVYKPYNYPGQVDVVVDNISDERKNNVKKYIMSWEDEIRSKINDNIDDFLKFFNEENYDDN